MGTKETPIEDLRKEALKHYNSVSSLACQSNSFVKEAIENYNPVKITGETFVKKFIKSEADLPKEVGYYYCHEKGNVSQAILLRIRFDADHLNDWLANVDWYLIGIIDKGLSRERVKELLNIAYQEGYNNTRSPQFDKWVNEVVNETHKNTTVEITEEDEIDEQRKKEISDLARSIIEKNADKIAGNVTAKYNQIIAILEGRDYITDEEIEAECEKQSFRVPYDGSNDFYDEKFAKGFMACAKWLLSKIRRDDV